MRPYFKFLVFVLAAACSLTASARGGYLGVDYEHGIFTLDGVDDDFNPTAIRLRSGTFYDRYLGVEGHVAIGIDEDQQGINEFELDNLYGLYLIAQLPAADWLSFFGRAGIAWTRGTTTTAVSKREFDESDFSFGAGLSITMTDRTDLIADWTQYLDDSDVGEYSSLNLGLTFFY